MACFDGRGWVLVVAAATLGCHQFNPDFARGEDGADERGAGTETPPETESGEQGEQGESSATDSSGAETTTSTEESSTGSSSTGMGSESSSSEEGSTSTEEGGSSEEGPVDTSEGPFDTGEGLPLDEGFDLDTGNTACVPLMPGDECQECAAAECCEYYELCSQPTKCSCFVQCVGEGGTVVACMVDCGQPELGDTEAGALALCVFEACSTPCSL